MNRPHPGVAHAGPSARRAPAWFERAQVRLATYGRRVCATATAVVARVRHHPVERLFWVAMALLILGYLALLVLLPTGVGRGGR